MPDHAPAAEADAYILGTDRIELERLGLQHQAWLAQALTLWEDARFAAGQTLLDLGCGPGYTTLDLAPLAGPKGRVLGVDRSASFVAALDSEADRRGWRHVEARQADLTTLELAPASVDGAYARWVFCWLDDPAAALARVAGWLRPGAALVLQEYLHWGTFALVPAHPSHAAAVAACLRSWELAGVRIDLARELPAMARAAGLELELLRPVARVGRPGSLVWRWVFGFLDSYLPRLAERGQIDAALHAQVMAAVDERAAEPGAHVVAPVLADVILRKPAR